MACCRVGRDRHGALTQAFPPNTKATAYPWWDDTADRVETAAFGGTTNLGGISVYRFDVLVPPVAIDHVDVPAKAAGEAGAGPVSLDWWYRSRTDLLVDPVSGIILKGRQVADQWLADATGTRRLTVATTSLTDTPSTVAANMQLAAAARRPIQARSSWPFLLAPLVAVVLLAAAEAREAAGPGMTNATGRHPARGSFEPVGVGERDFGVRSRAS